MSWHILLANFLSAVEQAAAGLDHPKPRQIDASPEHRYLAGYEYIQNVIIDAQTNTNTAYAAVFGRGLIFDV